MAAKKNYHVVLYRLRGFDWRRWGSTCCAADLSRPWHWTRNLCWVEGQTARRWAGWRWRSVVCEPASGCTWRRSSVSRGHVESDPVSCRSTSVWRESLTEPLLWRRSEASLASPAQALRSTTAIMWTLWKNLSYDTVDFCSSLAFESIIEMTDFSWFL